LRGSWPNPFTVTTRIDFELAHAGPATADVFDVAGRSVKQLVAGELPAGPHAIAWDGTDDNGTKVAPGVYFYRLATAGFSASMRTVRLSTIGG
jgi:flagellar hook assembly protein FlgD